MKVVYACYVGSPRRIELREREMVPGEHQVLVKISACGICRYDQHLMKHEPDQLVDGFGHEALGQVVACGPKVAGFKEGDWVVGWIPYGFSSYSVVGTGGIFHVPAELGDVACLAEPVKCVTTVVRAAKPDFGDTVAVVGCGFMGLATVAALAGHWTKRIVAIEMDAKRRQMALDFGATDAIDPRDHDVPEVIREMTAGKGADIAIEFAGNSAAATMATNLVRYRGRVLLAAGETPSENFYSRAITLHVVPPMFSPDEIDDFHRTIAHMASGRVRLNEMVSHRFKLSEIEQAFEEAGRAGTDYMKGLVVNDFG